MAPSHFKIPWNFFQEKSEKQENYRIYTNEFLFKFRN